MATLEENEMCQSSYSRRLHKSGLERVFYDTWNHFQRDCLKSIAWLKILYLVSPSVSLKDRFSRAAIDQQLLQVNISKSEKIHLFPLFLFIFLVATFLCELKDGRI